MTTLTTWKPARGLFDIHGEVNHLFDNLWGTRSLPHGAVRRNWAPPVDIVNANDRIEIRVEVPGLSEDDVNVSITENVLTLKGEKKYESDENTAGEYRRVERKYGKFQRSFTLPGNLQTDQTKAGFKNGVLTISVPKTEQAQPKEIPVTTE